MDNSANSGRGADSPADIPPQGWKEVLKRVGQNVIGGRIMNDAASVTFYTLLALFPALAAFVSVCGLITDTQNISGDINILVGFLPDGGMTIITEQLKALTENPPQALGVGLITGLLVSLWSANAGVKSLFASLNDVYNQEEKRGFFRLTATSLSLTGGGIFCLVLLIGATLVVPELMMYFGLNGVFDKVAGALRWPLIFILLTLFLSLLYRFGPSRKEAHWRWITWGSAMACFMWVATSAGFSFYVAHFGSYNKTYGSLGAAIGFMTWIWISAIVILAGADIDAQLERQAGIKND